MKLKAKDTLFISSVSSENIPPNGEFEVSDAEGERLIKEGLATAVKAASKAKNKMAKSPSNTAK
jgi:hypothetical protein